MGYNMYQQESKFTLPAASTTAALEALRAWAWARRAGPFVRADLETVLRAKTLEVALEACRWRPDFNEAGDVIDLTFEGGKVGGDEEVLGVLAPFVTAGSYVQMLGEDGTLWRWVFHAGTCTESYPTWPMP